MRTDDDSAVSGALTEDRMGSAASEPAAERGDSGAFAAVVNDTRVMFQDPVPDGRQILTEAGFVPADEHVLIQLVRRGTRSIGLDEAVDLRKPGIEAFRAFKSDRLFRFTVDGRGYEWGAPTINEPTLREVADVDEDHVLVLEREDAEDRVLGPDDRVKLSDAGTERLRTRKRLVTVCIDGAEKKIPAGVYSTEQLIEVLGVEPGYLLNLVNAEGQLELLKPNAKLRVKDGMKFFSQVPCGGSS